jgi:hypothetical protein
MIDRLITLQEHGRCLINNGSSVSSVIMRDEKLKKEISALSSYYLNRSVTGCKNCYMDALIELCSLKKSFIMNKTTLFLLKRGKMLKDSRNHDARLTLVRGAETDEKALYHIHANPDNKRFFETLPDDETLAKMLDEYDTMLKADNPPVSGRANEGAKAEADTIVEAAKAEAAVIVEAAKSKSPAKKTVTDKGGDPIME